MRVRLRDIKPNSFRDFAVDPLDEKHVADLKKSIEDNDFWGGAPCRQNGSGIEAAAGWHRINAAIAAGVEFAELYVAPSGKMSDADLIRIYAVEGATQRGEVGTARAGSVASAIKYLARAILTGNDSGIPESFSGTAKLAQLRRHLTGENGIGEPIITEFLQDIPGINKNTVTQQLKNLKSSGIYDRLIGEVRDAIAAEAAAEAEAAAQAEAERIAAAAKAAEQAEARRKADEQRARERAEAKAAKEKRDAEIAKEREAKKKLALEEKAKRDAENAERAEAKRKEAEARDKERAAENAKRQKEAEAKAAEAKVARDKAAADKAAADKAKAASAEQKRKIEAANKGFDFEGVSKHLDVADHIDYFRKLVTDDFKDHIKRDEQAEIAKNLVEGLAKVKATGTPAARFESFNSFAYNNLFNMVEQIRRGKRKMEEAELRAAEEADFDLRAGNYITRFGKDVRGAYATLSKLLRLQRDHPEFRLNLSPGFKTALYEAIEMLDQCRKAGLTDDADALFQLHQKGVRPAEARVAKVAAMLDNENDGERHNAADTLFRMARDKKLTIAQLLGIN